MNAYAVGGVQLTAEIISAGVIIVPIFVLINASIRGAYFGVFDMAKLPFASNSYTVIGAFYGI